MKGLNKFVVDWIVPILAAVILAVLVKEFLFYPIKVPTESMYPTIKINDKILVTKVYRPQKLKRGDIIVFYSKELNESLIKRLIGLPGDEIRIDNDGSVYVNNVKKSEPYVVYNGGIGGTYKVPAGKYFFLGDNRANSKDSRYWNDHFIAAKDIKGKAHIIIFPFSRFGKLK